MVALASCQHEIDNGYFRSAMSKFSLLKGSIVPVLQCADNNVYLEAVVTLWGMMMCDTPDDVCHTNVVSDIGISRAHCFGDTCLNDTSSY